MEEFLRGLFSYYHARFAPATDALARKNFMLALKNVLSYLDENYAEIEKGNAAGYNEMMHLIVEYCKAQGLSEPHPGEGFVPGLYTLVKRACHRLGLRDEDVFMLVMTVDRSGRGLLSDLLYSAHLDLPRSHEVVRCSRELIRAFLQEHAPGVRLD